MDQLGKMGFSAVDDEWEIDPESRAFRSPDGEGNDYQRLIFDEPFRDGTVSVSITIQEGRKVELGGESRLGAIIFRYSDPMNYYFAGVGGYTSRFFIAKMVSGQAQPLVAGGASRSIRKNTPYHVQIQCVGNRMTLSHNGITHLNVADETFNSGPWGLQTWRSVAEFNDPIASVVKPTCFVIMPFAEEYDSIYDAIRETVENHGFDCVRADQRYNPGTITEDVIDQIQKADLIVADLTGKNANVFFETGFAAALRKPVIQIAQSVGDLPFDVRHLRTFAYDTKMFGDRKLAHDLGEAIKATTGFGLLPAARKGA